jgi:hypothetical protein
MFHQKYDVAVALGINAVVATILSSATLAFWFTRRLEKSMELSFATNIPGAGECIHNELCARSATLRPLHFANAFKTNLQVRLRPLRFGVCGESITVGRRCGSRRQIAARRFVG